jgi:transposase
VIDGEDLEFLRQLVLSQPSLSHANIIEILKIQRQKTIAKSTLCNTLKRLGLVKYRSSKSKLPRPKPKPKNLQIEDNLEKPTKKYSLQPGRFKLQNDMNYSSDLSNEAWELVRDLFEKTTKKGRPSKISKRQIVNAIFYVCRTGCQWELLPSDFPNFRTVKTYFRNWKMKGLWQKMGERLRRKYREKIGKQEEPSAGSVDSQSTKTTEKGGPEDSMATKR